MVEDLAAHYPEVASVSMDKGFHSPANQRAPADIKGATALAHRLASGAEVNRIEALAGLVTAPSRGRPRRLEDFDPASLLARGRSDES